MADTFIIREEPSDESILAVLESRRSQLDNRSRRRLDFFDDRTRVRRTLPVIEASHELMDLLVFATIVLLWTSGLIMIIFGVYVLISEYGLSVLITLNLYPYTMILQCLAALTILLGAAVTTSLLTLDHGVPKRAIIGLVIVIISILLLITEIIVGTMSKAEIKQEEIEAVEMEENPPEFLKEEARRKGLTCRRWHDKACEPTYKEHASNYANYLIGSASVALGIDVMTLPVFIFVNRVTLKEIAQGTVYTSRTKISESPSLLSVNTEPTDSEEEVKPSLRLGGSQEPCTSSTISKTKAAGNSKAAGETSRMFHYD